MCDIVSNMKTATVRHVQHNFAAVLEAVRKGQEIAITKRGTVVARIVPARKAKGPITWPDSAARMKRLGPRAATGTPASRIVREMRGERF
jgi:prevent-host-death family protein